MQMQALQQYTDLQLFADQPAFVSCATLLLQIGTSVSRLAERPRCPDFLMSYKSRPRVLRNLP